MRREIIAHLLAAFGVLCAIFSVLAVFDQAWEYVYGWLGLALLLQALASDDLALLPDLESDANMDVDASQRPPDPASAIAAFLTAVFVPVVAMLHAGFLDGWSGVAVAGIILLSSLYRLAFLVPNEPQVPVTSYIGLPAVWSVWGFYLHAFDATPLAAVLTIGLGIVLGLVPMNWPNPLYSAHWRPLTRALVGVWFATAAFTLFRGLPATSPAKAILLAIAAYGLLLTARLARPSAVRASKE